MAMSVLSFGQIRDLVSNLGWRENDKTYVVGEECLDTLQSIEEELIKEDVINRNVHISLHICGTVKKDLIPILLHAKDRKILAVALRVLVNLSLPVECLLPVGDALSSNKAKKTRKELLSASLEIKRAFLVDATTFSIVSMLREAMIKSEKHNLPLSEDDCIQLNNCLILLQNLIHMPEESNLIDDLQSWQYVQNKLIWNLFVQGLDGALLLMLNSKYRAHWTVPISLIIALLYRNQNVTKIHEAIELISSASDTSCDEEESDGSKNSYASLSSEQSKATMELSDSGCIITSDTSNVSGSDPNISTREKVNLQSTQQSSFNFDIYTELEKVQISDDSEPQTNLGNKSNHLINSFMYRETDYESSSSSDSPHHKRMKGSTSYDDQDFMSEDNGYNSKRDYGITENLGCSIDNQAKTSIEADKKSVKNFKAVQKLRSLQMHANVLESDSSNEDTQNIKIKYRNHPPTCKRGKSPRRNNGCTPSVCLDSAIAASAMKGRMKYPLWEKRNSVTTLVDLNSPAPSDKDIGNLIKEFTITFLHGGFGHLVEDLKDLFLSGSHVAIDKSLLFWILSYFLHLSATVHLNVDHLSNILNPDIIGYLLYECVWACENLELRPEVNIKVKKCLFDHLNLVVTSLKEIMVTIDIYAKKATLQKDKAFFSDLYGKLADFENLRLIPLLLFQTCHQIDAKSFTENVVILNHHILITIEKGMKQYPMSQKFNLVQHLKHFSSKNVVNCYGSLLENYKYNSDFLNECLFTMMHHIAGDVHTSDSLIEPSILKTFSSILKEDIDLEPYQEDLIMYILNKFSLQIQKTHLKKSKEEGECSYSSEHSSNVSSSINCLLSDEEDDLFWWYLQFEQDKDPIARISEHISLSKRDILTKLHVKGIVSLEKYKHLEEIMENTDEGSSELLSCEGFIEMENFDDEITHLLRTLVQSGWRQQLTWIQDALLEICYIRLGLKCDLPEPIPYYSLKTKMSVPLVPYTKEQLLILQDQTFLKLLEKIGFQLGTDTCPAYPRIPLFWSAHVLFTIAARLGPLRKDKLKFSYKDLMLAESNYDDSSGICSTCPSLPPLSSCYTLSSWLAAVQISKEEQKLHS